MTTYTLRTGSPAKIKSDAVVVGVSQGSDGPRLASGGEDVAQAYGRKLAPLLSSLGVTGKAGESITVPTDKVIGSSLLVLVGLGRELDPASVRRAAGVAARAVPNAASVALALPADSPELVRAVAEGHRLGGYTFTAYKKDPKPASTAEVVVLSPESRARRTSSPPSTRPASSPRRSPRRGTGSTPLPATCVRPGSPTRSSPRPRRPTPDVARST